MSENVTLCKETSSLFCEWIWLIKIDQCRLERWLTGQKHILVLQSTCVQFLVLMLGSSQLPITLAPS